MFVYGEESKTDILRARVLSRSCKRRFLRARVHTTQMQALKEEPSKKMSEMTIKLKYLALKILESKGSKELLSCFEAFSRVQKLAHPPHCAALLNTCSRSQKDTRNRMAG